MKTHSHVLGSVMLVFVLAVALAGLVYIYQGAGRAVQTDGRVPVSVDFNVPFELKTDVPYMVSVDSVFFDAFVISTSKTYAIVKVAGDFASGEYMLTPDQPATFDGIRLVFMASNFGRVRLVAYKTN